MRYDSGRDAGWSSQVARRAHNPEVAGSNPAPAISLASSRFRYPVVVGGGTPFLPPVGEAVALDLIETRTFGSRVVYERYGRARGVGLTPPFE